MTCACVRFGGHHLVHQSGKGCYAGGGFAATDHVGAVDVVGGEVRQRAVSGVLGLDAHRPIRGRREVGLSALASLDSWFLVGAEYEVVLAERFTVEYPSVEIEGPCGFGCEIRVAGKYP